MSRRTGCASSDRDGARTDVARYAYLERNVIIAQAAHKVGILHGSDAVANRSAPSSTHAHIDARPIGFACVRHQCEAVPLDEAEHIAEPFRRAADLISSDPERHDAILLPFDCQFCTRIAPS